MKVIHFSGGRTSAYMTIHTYEPGDIVIFADTGREHPKTYKFINDFEAHEGIPVIRVSYYGGWQKLLKARRAVPNYFKRFCTEELKVKTARRYLRSLGHIRYTQFIGFRHDEQVRVQKYNHRWKKVATRFPLDEMKATKPDVLEYWSKKPYDLEIPAIHGNCIGCFMKGEAALMAIYKENPEYADVWINDEETMGYTYLKGVSHRQLRDKAQLLKKDYDLNLIQSKFNCACGT